MIDSASLEPESPTDADYAESVRQSIKCCVDSAELQINDDSTRDELYTLLTNMIDDIRTELGNMP